MKIKKIAEFCKKEGNIVVYLTSDGPWIGTQSAIYFTPELNGISEAGLYSILDIPENKRDTTPIRYIDSLDIKDINEAVKDEPMDKMTLRLKGRIEIIPLLGFGGKVALLNSKYLSPLPSDVELFLRSGLVYVKRGMLLISIISPVIQKSEQMITELEYVARHIQDTIEDDV
nr:MAG TPA: hypothetical protein [Caudoviricetes sp.]